MRLLCFLEAQLMRRQCSTVDGQSLRESGLSVRTAMMAAMDSLYPFECFLTATVVVSSPLAHCDDGQAQRSRIALT